MDNVSKDRAAHAAWERGDFKVAYRLLSALVRAGYTDAEMNLGTLIQAGLGTRLNWARGMHFYRRAYRRGSAAAAHNIAIAYREAGRPRQSFAWYRRAAALKDGDAEVELAKCYLNGIGIARHRGRAAAALKRALRSKYISEDGRQEARALRKRVAPR